MSQILKNAKNYKRIPKTYLSQSAHLNDPYTPPPQILKQDPKLIPKQNSPTDISTFPKYQTIPIPEAIPYREGKYRPPSVPIIGGYYPYNIYLEKGKVYWYCACGASNKAPFCDQKCNTLISRLRPIYFNVNESGYYKLCNCKQSSNQPFCNGTHRDVFKHQFTTVRGLLDYPGVWLYFISYTYVFWNFFT